MRAKSKIEEGVALSAAERANLGVQSVRAHRTDRLESIEFVLWRNGIFGNAEWVKSIVYNPRVSASRVVADTGAVRSWPAYAMLEDSWFIVTHK